MIPAEARNVIDTLAAVKHDKEQVLDAIDCLSRIVSPSSRDRERISRATKHLNKEQANV